MARTKTGFARRGLPTRSARIHHAHRLTGRIKAETEGSFGDLEVQDKHFVANREDRLQFYEYQFALYKDEEFLGTYKSLEDATDAGVKRASSLSKREKLRRTPCNRRSTSLRRW